ncbi:sensor histidine kinase [Streptomyces sp. NPDC056352]|uniref:sensor histidine kinase n=1 Tax=Streptomyces sp. NPDC056352 TaxID=3345791 RepID=UPI0035DE6A68
MVVDAGAVAGRVDVRVIDRGPGISEVDSDNPFQPFRRSQPHDGGANSGVGLGLTVAKGFVKATSGELTVESASGGGTTFVFGLRVWSGAPTTG